MSHDSHEASAARPGPVTWILSLIGAGLLGCIIYFHYTQRHVHGVHGPEEAPALWVIGVLPFVALLGAIAILPLLPATHRWWESNRNRLIVALVCGGLALVYYVFARGWEHIPHVLNHAIAVDYVPFIILLFSLYVISGGICLKGDLAARPMVNAGFLAFGALIASFIGTTGASMLLIRPLLQTNSERRHVVHTVVFFIFLVSNIGGCLLPIGDPPLFLGYLRGVDFFWTFNLWKEWAFCCGILLVIYFLLDTYFYRKERVFDLRRDATEKQPLRLTGLINILWLAGIVASVAFVVPEKPFPFLRFTTFPFLRELLMLLLVVVSLATTPKGVRADNEFNYAAILEVAALFVGIFIAMQVPIEVLGVKGEKLGLTEPWHFFWATGSLSSFLDNAPTYVVFFETAKSLSPEVFAHTIISAHLLVGISVGAVFMGSMTYIGNGPNFMVKAIAEQSGVKMPSFFGYMFRYSIPMLIPVFVIVTLIFLRGGGHEAAGVHSPTAEAPAAQVESGAGEDHGH